MRSPLAQQPLWPKWPFSNECFKKAGHVEEGLPLQRGLPLPWHLLVRGESFKHVLPTEGGFEQKGTQLNGSKTDGIILWRPGENLQSALPGSVKRSRRQTVLWLFWILVLVAILP